MEEELTVAEHRERIAKLLIQQKVLQDGDRYMEADALLLDLFHHGIKATMLERAEEST